MKQADIVRGQYYLATVNGRLTTVHVDCVRVSLLDNRRKFDVTNVKTGRRTTFRSAAKFRQPMPAPTV